MYNSAINSRRASDEVIIVLDIAIAIAALIIGWLGSWYMSRGGVNRLDELVGSLRDQLKQRDAEHAEHVADFEDRIAILTSDLELRGGMDPVPGRMLRLDVSRAHELVKTPFLPPGELAELETCITRAHNNLLVIGHRL